MSAASQPQPAYPPDEWVRCPRCFGTGSWPPAVHHVGTGLIPRCDWCAGCGELTRAELAEFLRAQKQRRIDAMRMTPDERNRKAKWDS